MRIYRLSACALAVIALMAVAPAPPAAAGYRFEIDANHSSAEFKVRHLGISTVTGRFEEFSGAINYDPAVPEAATVEVLIAVASINTDVDGRDNHLRSADFFDAENFPELTFRSTAVRNLGEGVFEVDGDLTIRGTTRPVTLEAEFGGMIDRQGRGGAMKTIAFSAETRIDRKEFGLTWNRALEAGGVLVGDQVRILLEVEANAQVEAS